MRGLKWILIFGFAVAAFVIGPAGMAIADPFMDQVKTEVVKFAGPIGVSDDSIDFQRDRLIETLLPAFRRAVTVDNRPDPGATGRRRQPKGRDHCFGGWQQV